MTAQWEERLALREECAKLILEWIELVGPKGKLQIVKSCLRKYTIEDLRDIKTHVSEEVRETQSGHRGID